MKKIIILALALLASNVFAGTCTSRSSRVWSNANNWRCTSGASRHVPTSSDDVVVNNDIITLDQDTANVRTLTVKSSGKLVFSGSNILNVAGDVTVSGSFETPSSGDNTDININVGGDFTVDSNGFINARNQSSTTINVNIGGDLINSGLIQSYQSGTFVVGGLTTNSGDIDFKNSAINLTSNSFSNSGTIDLSFSSDSFVVTNNLTNDGLITLGSASRTNTLNVGGTLTNNSTIIANTGNVPSGGSTGLSTNAQEIKINNLINNATGLFTVTSSPNFIFSGNVANSNNNLNFGRASVSFVGTTQQTISGFSRVYSLVIDNNNGVLLNSDMLVGMNSSESGNLYLINGKIQTSSNASIGYTVSCDRTVYVYQNNGSWVEGRFKLTFPSYAVTCTALVGDEQNYSPVTISPNTWLAQSAGDLIVDVTKGDHPDTVSQQSGVDVNKSINRYVELLSLSTPGMFSTSKYKLTINYCDAVNVPNCKATDLDSGINISNVVGYFLDGTWQLATMDSKGTNGIFKTITFKDMSAMGTLVIGEYKAPIVLSCSIDDFTNGVTGWNLSGNTYTPQVITVGSKKRLRLNDASGNRSTLAQNQKLYPGAGNKMVVEFDYYVYGGNGADGITVTLSDASKVPSPGAYGGSLGYANGNGLSGFNGGWLSVGIDEYGNFPNPTENRRGYPTGWTAPSPANKTAGFYKNNVSVRGSGSTTNGYYLLANSGTLSTPIWNNSSNSSSLQKFRITIDHSNNINVYITVERDTTGTGSSYSVVIPKFDAKGANSLQDPMPTNLYLSFTGSTGGSTNNHEFSNLSTCAYYVIDPNGSKKATNFECLEPGTLNTWSTTARKPIYTKLVNTNFNLDVAALKTDGTIEQNFVSSGGADKTVLLELFDATTPLACASYTSPIASQNVTFTSTSNGRITTGVFNLNKAYPNLIARIKDSTDINNIVYGCSTDLFTVRPLDFTVTSNANADNLGISDTATPKIKAGDNFTITSTALQGYNGTPQIFSSLAEWTNQPIWGRTIAENGVGVVSGTFPSANILTGVASGNFTYSEAGYFRLKVGGVLDNSFTNNSSDQINSDCIANSASNILSGGKYGCNVQNNSITNYFGRFIPFGYTLTTNPLVNRSDLVGSSNFTYLGEPLKIDAYLTPVNSGGGVVLNYNRNNFDSSLLANWNLGVSQNLTSRLQLTNTASVWGANGTLNTILTMQVNRDINPDGSFNNVNIVANPKDKDGVSLLASQLDYDLNLDSINESKIIGQTNLYFGRMKLNNVMGSDLLKSPVSIEAQYFNGSGFVTNTNDNLTSFDSTKFSLTNFSGNITSNEVSLTFPGTLINGKQTIVVNKPSGGDGKYDGSFDLNYDLLADSKSYLWGKWSGSTYSENPKGKIILSRKSNQKIILFKENY
ncbi:hypothetical protein GW796_06760 [archaeon]|nr:hypothetical protein [archaeon]